jgi:hypothetical protein
MISKSGLADSDRAGEYGGKTGINHTRNATNAKIVKTTPRAAFGKFFFT